LGSIGVIPKPFDPVDLPALLLEIWDSRDADRVATSQ
jgi:hypothetical protein